MADTSDHHSIIFGVSPASDTMWDFARYDGGDGLIDCTAADERKLLHHPQQQQQQPGIDCPHPAAAAAEAACHQAPGAFVDAMTAEDWEILGHLESAFRCHDSMTSINSNNWQQQQQQQQQQLLLPVSCGVGRISSPGSLPQLQCVPPPAAAAAAFPTPVPAVFSSGSATAPSQLQQEVHWTQQQQQRQQQQQYCCFSMGAAVYSAAAMEAELEAAAAAMDPNLSANSDHTADAQNASGCSSLLGSGSPGNATAAVAAAATTAAAAAAVGPEAGARRPRAAAAAAIALKRSGSSSGTPCVKGQRISRARHDQEMTRLVEQVEQLTAENQRLQQRTATLLSSEQDMLKRVATLTEKWRASVAANDALQRENIALRQQLAAVQQQQQRKQQW